MSGSDASRNPVVIITGASSGIGRATALALARSGARLALAARTPQTLESVTAECQALGADAVAVPTDVTSEEQVRRLVQATTDRWGRVDILVTCAGAYIRAHATKLTKSDIERSMAVNFYGVLHCVLAVMPLMLAQKSGHMILVTSFDGKRGLPLDAPYVAAKCAATGLADCLRQDLRGTGVYVTTILPGRVDTPLIASLRVPAISAKIPPEAVAAAIVRALRTRQPEVILPFGVLLLHYASAISPRLGDWLVRVTHLEGWEVEPAGSGGAAGAE